MKQIENQFLSATDKHSARTENNAVAHKSTGDVLADQFSKSGSHRDRPIGDVFVEQARLHNYDAEKALKFVFYLRLVTRKTQIFGSKTEKVQKGQGQRDESFKRFLWYANNYPELFYNNIWLFIPVGRYQDIFDIMYYGHLAKLNLDESRILGAMLNYARTDPNVDLLKKYIPLVDSSATTERAKYMNHVSAMLRNMLGFDSDEELRKYKTSGTAHAWQQKISQQRFDEINFDNVPGRALHRMVSSDFLLNNGLVEDYTEWIKSQGVAKFTGYPYELMLSVDPRDPIYKKYTYDKQFEGLIELAKEDEGGISGNVWCAIDTSRSMRRRIGSLDGNLRVIDVCLSLGIYFSTLNEGAFHKNVIMFDNESRVKQLSGTFSEMTNDLTNERTAWGGTNFQSVVDEIIRIRTQNPEIPLSDYPQTLLVVSDMQFNPASQPSSGWGSGRKQYRTAKDKQTNHEIQMSKLRNHFPKEWVDQFRVIWWDCTGRVTDNQPTHIDEGGTYVFSGWDGAVITLLLGGDEKDPETGEKVQKTLTEAIDDTLSQEVFEHIEI